jgi:hypothetical protein
MVFATIIGLAIIGTISVPAGAETPAPLAYPPVFFTMHWLDFSGHFQAVIQNMTPRGYANAVTWTPPPSITVTAITSSKGGTCHLTADGTVACNGRLAPPTCVRGTCYPSAGSSITITFTAALTGIPPGPGSTFEGLSLIGTSLQVTDMTFLPPSYNDLPLCRKGQSSTKAKPCSTI